MFKQGKRMSGLIILPILIVYILFAIFMYKLTASKIVLIAILLFPVWDLIIQKGIKTYYQIFESDPIIYAMPEFDKDGKIESLGVGDVTTEPISIFEKKENYKIYTKVDDFIEFRTVSDKYDLVKLIKVFIKNKKYIDIDKSNARYQILASLPKSYFFNLYQKRDYTLIDIKQNNKILAKSFEVHFSNKYNLFRRNVLFWQTGTGGNLVYVSRINNINLMFKKIFSIGLRFNTSKGWDYE